jgi:flagellar protein FliO/FliZ
MNGKIHHNRSRLPKMVAQLTLYSCTIVFSSLANAAELNLQKGAVKEAGFEVVSGLGVGSLMQMFVALVVVLLLIVGLSLMLKKLNIVSNSSSGLISVIAGIPLSGKDRLLLIQVGTEQILLSASPGNIRKLHCLNSPLPTDAEVATRGKSENSFAKLLHSLKSGRHE